MSGFAHRRPVATLAFAALLGGCGTIDSTLFSGDGTYAYLPDAEKTAQNKQALAEINDPKVFLTTAAQISEKEKNYKSAAGHWAQLYLANPKDKTAALNLAENLRFIGRYEDGERILRQAMRDKPGDADLQEELAKTLIASGRLREGAEMLTGLAAHPGLPPSRLSKLHSAIGVAFDRAGNHAEAQASYGHALRADPLNAIALSNLGLSYALTGDLDLAEAKLREALIAPNASVQVRQNLAMVLALKGDTKAAERLARQDLPASQAKQIVSYYGNIGDQADVWSDAAAQ